MNQTRVLFLAIIICSLFFISCMAHQTVIPLPIKLPGFWMGLWHGIIAPIDFIVSLFNAHVRIYEVPNAGRWYDFGFMIGIGGFVGGLFAASKNRRR